MANTINSRVLIALEEIVDKLAAEKCIQHSEIALYKQATHFKKLAIRSKKRNPKIAGIYRQVERVLVNRIGKLYDKI